MLHATPFRSWLPLLAWACFFLPNLIAAISLKYSLQTLLAICCFSPLLIWRPTRWLAVWSLALIGAVNLVHIAFFGHLADEFFLATALRTTPAESSEFIHIVPLTAWLSASVWLLACLLLGRYLLRHFKEPSPRPGYWRKLWSLAAAIWLVFLGYSWSQHLTLHDFLYKTKRLYPMHLAFAALRQSDLSDHLLKAPKLPDFAPNTAQQVDTLVVVFGESTSAHRWSRLGYAGANTNAPLAGIAQLHTQTVLAQGTNTAAALPFVLTGQSALDSVQSQSPSFIDLAQAAGYKTFVYSNSHFTSSREDFFSRALRRSTNVFDKVGDGDYDEVLTPSLKKALADPAPRKLIVLHTWGSHPIVERRTPAKKRAFTDPYDNSVHYISSLLAEWIQLTEQATTDRRAALLYTSDHGVLLPPCADYRQGTGLSSLEVPLLTWMNPTLASQNILSAPHTTPTASSGEHSNALLAEIAIQAIGWSDWLGSPNWHSSLAPKFNGMTWTQLRQRNACTLK